MSQAESRGRDVRMPERQTSSDTMGSDAEEPDTEGSTRSTLSGPRGPERVRRALLSTPQAAPDDLASDSAQPEPSAEPSPASPEADGVAPPHDPAVAGATEVIPRSGAVEEAVGAVPAGAAATTEIISREALNPESPIAHPPTPHPVASHPPVSDSSVPRHSSGPQPPDGDPATLAGPGDEPPTELIPVVGASGRPRRRAAPAHGHRRRRPARAALRRRPGQQLGERAARGHASPASRSAA